MRLSPKAIARLAVRKSFEGRAFRIYAPQSPPAESGSTLRVALVSLIPHLGDSVLLFPLLDALQDANPDVDITVFTSGMGEITALHPAVHRVQLYSAKRAWLGGSMWELWQFWKTECRDLRFHVCVVPRGGVEPFRSAHLAWMLGGSIRAGYSPGLEPELADSDLGAERLFNTVVKTRGGLHEVERGAEVLIKAGLLQRSPDIRRPVRSLLSTAHSPAGREFMLRSVELANAYAVAAPGASIARRRWQLEGFAEIMETEMIQRGIVPVLIGSFAERSLCEEVASLLSRRPLIFTGLRFTELAALCAGANFFIGNDSGPGHVAGAMGVPTVEVTAFSRAGNPWHHSSPLRSRPCGPWVTVLQPDSQMPPCSVGCTCSERHCISQVGVTEVRSALHDLIVRRHSAFNGDERASCAVQVQTFKNLLK